MLLLLITGFFQNQLFSRILSRTHIIRVSNGLDPVHDGSKLFAKFISIASKEGVNGLEKEHNSIR